MSTDEIKLKGNKKRLSSPWPLGEIPVSVIKEIGKHLVHRLAIGQPDITGDDFGNIFARAIDGAHKNSPLGLADVVLERTAWSIKTIKRKHPFNTSTARFISGRNSPDYSMGIKNPHEDIQATGKVVLRIWNSRVNEALNEYDSLRVVNFIRNLQTKEFLIFEEDAEKFIVDDYEWRKNKSGNFEGHHIQNKVHKFTWQPHGSQFTMLKKVPPSATKFIINKNTPIIEFDHILRLACFQSDWIEIID